MAGQWKWVLFAAFWMGVFREGATDMESILEDPDHPDYIYAKWNYSDHKLAESMEQMMKKLMPMVIRGSSSIELSGPCMGAMFKMFLGMRQGKLWPFLSVLFVNLWSQGIHQCDIGQLLQHSTQHGAISVIDNMCYPFIQFCYIKRQRGYMKTWSYLRDRVFSDGTDNKERITRAANNVDSTILRSIEIVARIGYDCTDVYRVTRDSRMEHM
ncbi:uncharacterized protein TNCV_4382841 [Trichonephila clavipes]|nr:uncharacterized protein TNCV_4382841 [Trichonephila clavipes]